MLKTWIGILSFVGLLAGCGSMMPSAQELQAVPIQGASGRAVVYVVRSNPDLSIVAAQIALDGQLLGTSYEGTYFRVELSPGRHRLSGYGVDGGNLTFDVQADRVYFIQQHVAGIRRSPTSLTSNYRLIDESRARAVMARGSRMG